MKCPFCGHLHDKVVDSRESKEGDAIRRRRRVPGVRAALHHIRANRRSSLHGDQEGWPAGEVRPPEGAGGAVEGLRKASGQHGRLSELVNRVESKVSDSPDREISTTDIGEILMESLRDLDKIAYVRFASVYRDFQDEQAFFNELKNLMRQKGS